MRCRTTRYSGSRRAFGKQVGAMGLGLAADLLLPGSISWAATYPTKQVSIVVGYPAGGSGDTVARVVAQQMFPSATPTIVENKPGASGNIAAQYVARAAPDGHTILLGHTTEMCINQFIAPTNFDPAKDLVPVAMLFSTPHAIAVAQGSKYVTVQDLIADARANPGKVTFASAGRGTPGHLAGEALMRGANVQFVHVPYKGAGQTVSDVIGGHIDFYFAALPATISHVKAKQIRYLAMASPRRLASLPDVPTVSEVTGITPYDYPVWGGLFVPAGTPAGVVTAINQEVNRILAMPDVKARLAGLNADISIWTPAQFGEFVKVENAKYQKIIKDVGLKE